MRQAELQSLLAPILPKGTRVTKATHLTDLWAGYGHIYRIHVEHPPSSSSTRLDDTYIVKYIRPPPQQSAYDEGHARKMLSYRVEGNFYRHFAHIVAAEELSVPALFASADDAGEGGELLVLEDISIRFPVLTERRGTLDPAQIRKSLEWLANFHARSWNITRRSDLHSFCPEPSAAANWLGSGLWKQGGYHYLSTRQQELSSISPTSHWGSLGLHANSDLPTAVDWCLNNPASASSLSLIHGDVKSANMAFNTTSTRMAMYDFQYVGIGLGVQDLAKFLTTSIPPHHLNQDGEETLLKTYHDFLTQNLPRGAEYSFDQLQQDWELALVSWTRFLAGWSGGFWGNVDWLQQRVERLLRDQHWVESVLNRWKTATHNLEKVK
ncbi:CHK domain-containing protein [Pseudozyma hubeiensis]|nr:CHK domain-containing protein [Pseudozyma hubeiensis]